MYGVVSVVAKGTRGIVEVGKDAGVGPMDII